MRTYCASTLSFSSFPLEDFVGKLSDGGISAIELSHTHFSNVEVKTITDIKQETGVQFKSLLSTVKIDTPEGLEDQISILDTAERLSVPIVSIASGGSEDATENEIDRIIDLLRSLTIEAKSRNLTLVLYAHEGSLAYNLNRTQKVLDAISEDNFGLYYSPYHFHKAGDDPVIALRTLSDRLLNVYFNCGIDSRTGSEPFWAPEMDFRAICNEIQRSGYNKEIMLIYLGLAVDSAQPIVEGVLNARSQLETYF